MATGTHSNPSVGALFAKADIFGRGDEQHVLPHVVLVLLGLGGDEPTGVREGRVGGGVQLRERRHDHAGRDDGGGGRPQAVR